MLPFQFRFYFQKYNPKKWLSRIPKRVFLLVGALLLALIIGFTALRSSKKTTPADTAFAEVEELIVGIAAPTAFGQVTPEGRVSGYEREVAAEVLARIYPDKPVRFVAITSQEASYLLKQGRIHMALGMYVSGPLKTQGLSLSNSYFTDGVYAFCSEQSTVDSLWALTNQRVRVLSSDITKSAVASMFKELEIEVDLHLCSSYPDGLASIQKGDCAALVGPRYKLEGLEGLRRISEPVGMASYRIMLWADHSDMTQLINEVLGNMRAEGTLAVLQQAHGIAEYSKQ